MCKKKNKFLPVVVRMHAAVLRHRYVSRPGIYSQVVVGLTVLQEVFHRHRWQWHTEESPMLNVVNVWLEGGIVVILASLISTFLTHSASLFPNGCQTNYKRLSDVDPSDMNSDLDCHLLSNYDQFGFTLAGLLRASGR